MSLPELKEFFEVSQTWRDGKIDHLVVGRCSCFYITRHGNNGGATLVCYQHDDDGNRRELEIDIYADLVGGLGEPITASLRFDEEELQ